MLDQISDPEVLAERIPRWIDRYDALKDIRSEARLGGRPLGQHFRRVASISESLLSRLQEMEPGFLEKRPVFYGWLRRHPEYSATDKVQGG